MDPRLTRRALLGRGAALAGALALPAPLRALAAPTDDFWQLDATAQAALVRGGEASPLELVDAAIARIEAIDPAINAVVTDLFDAARARARGDLPDGPFRGVPWLVKDLDDLAGAPTSGGSRFADPAPKTTSAPYVRRSLDAGVIPLGKSNTPEFGLIGVTESLALGVCRNPWDPEVTPGGSSGGAGAAVAAGLVPFAHATDGGGSIRIPASCCGLVGLKPSRGRLGPNDAGMLAIGAELCVSRSVRDTAAWLAATEYRGADAPLAPAGLVRGPSDRPLRIAVSSATYSGAPPHPDVEAALHRTAALCADLGHEVEDATPNVDGEAFIDAFMAVWGSGASGVVTAARDAGLDPEAVLEPWTLGLARQYDARPEGALVRAADTFAGLARVHAAFGERHDVWLTPTLSAPPVPIGAQAPTRDFDDLMQRVTDWVAYTPIHNAMGTPAISLPLGWSSGGLPIGLQFATRVGGERTLLGLAYALEAAAPWADRWPALARS
jgi:amidase